MNRPVKVISDPLTASLTHVDRVTYDVTVKQGDPVRIRHADALPACIGLYLLSQGFTGNETGYTRTLTRRDWTMQVNEWTDKGRVYLDTNGQKKADKLLKESMA